MLPANVAHQAKRCLVDALGCAVGAYAAPGRSIMETTVKQIGGPPGSHDLLLGSAHQCAQCRAGKQFSGAILDYSDLGGGGHNSDAISSILAVAEREKVNGKDFLTSLVVSYELGARFSESFPTTLEAQGLSPDMRAGLNQPPALGRMMELNEEQIANAIGICTSHTLPMGILDAESADHSAFFGNAMIIKERSLNATRSELRFHRPCRAGRQAS